MKLYRFNVEISDAVQVYQLLKNMGMTDELIIMDVLSAF